MLMFRDLVIRSSPFAYSVAYRMLNDEALARDAVQDTMIKVWKKLNGLNEDANFKSWLYRIVVNTCLDMLRKRKRYREVRPDEKTWQQLGASVAEGSNTDLDKKEIAAVIGRLTRKLSPAQKAVFVLCDLMQLSHEDIAEVMEMNKNSVKSNLHHARRKIAEMMVKYI